MMSIIKGKVENEAQPNGKKTAFCQCFNILYVATSHTADGTLGCHQILLNSLAWLSSEYNRVTCPRLTDHAGTQRFKNENGNTVTRTYGGGGTVLALNVSVLCPVRRHRR